MLNPLKFSGNTVSGSRRLPPSRSVAGSRGLMSLVVPTCAARACGRSWYPFEQPLTIKITSSASGTSLRTVGGGVTRTMPTTGDISMRSRDGGQQSPRVLVLRVGEHLVAIALLHERSAVHHRYPVGQV